MNYASNKSEEQQGDTERMKQLINMWWNADTIIGKILRYVYEHKDGVSEADLKEFIKRLGADDTWYNDLHLKCKNYQEVFERTHNRITKVRKEAKEYIDSL